MTGTGKSISVKEWFADKIANEIRKNINMCDVFAILRETEKAVYAVLNLGSGIRKTTWIPKSALIESDVYVEFGEESHYETYKADNYEEAIDALTSFWDQFR